MKFIIIYHLYHILHICNLKRHIYIYIYTYVVWPIMSSNEYRFNCFIYNHKQNTCIIIIVVIQLYILIIIVTLAKPVQVLIINRISYIV